MTDEDWLAFLDDGGYERPGLWLSDGWRTVQEQGWHAPLYWQQQDGEWVVWTLAGVTEQLVLALSQVQLVVVPLASQWLTRTCSTHAPLRGRPDRRGVTTSARGNRGG